MLYWHGCRGLIGTCLRGSDVSRYLCLGELGVRLRWVIPFSSFLFIKELR